MGSGNTRILPADSDSIKDQTLATSLVVEKLLIGRKLTPRRVTVLNNRIEIYDQDIGSTYTLVSSLSLDDRIEIDTSNISDLEVTIRQKEITLVIRYHDELIARHWIENVQRNIEILEAKRHSQIKYSMEKMESFKDGQNDDDTINEKKNNQIVDKTFLNITPPSMKIVIMVVGTRGDVQPFIYLGLELKSQGHIVRIATHSEYRDYVLQNGLLYYPLAGDPRKLSEYMVKTGGRLIPDLLNEEERTELPEKMQMLRDICYSTWPACVSPDPQDETKTPFLAEAIISNPVSYGHIHCAEALAIPLHIMFPQPWYPTKCFPHPLSNLGQKRVWSKRSKLSYYVVEDLMWMGTRSFINSFRTEVLMLDPIRPGEITASSLIDKDVPISHMWSPLFVPKCIDWPSHVDVVGEFTQKKTSASIPMSAYVPDKRLADFLEKEGKPIYIGFGSMVIEDGQSLVDIIRTAAEETNYAVILQSGWTKYGENFEMIGNKIMVVGPMPHDWLFQHVSAVIHHGGAGTTSAGLRAGNSTFICPFFGDQHFWAEMVYRAGAGPPGCPIKSLTPDILKEAFICLKSEEVISRAQQLGGAMALEDGVSEGVKSFYKNLPIQDMLCEVSVFDVYGKHRIAELYCPDCDLKISKYMHNIIHRPNSDRCNHNVMHYQCSKWGVAPPSGLLIGLKQGLGIVAYEMAGGVYDLVNKPIQGAKEGGALGAATGVMSGVYGLIARPVKGGKILVDRILDNNEGASISSSKKHVQKGAIENMTNMVDINPDELSSVEEALQEVLKFKELWMKLDSSGDRLVGLSELESLLSPSEAEAMMKDADYNGDGLLTFVELALKMTMFKKTRKITELRKVE